VRPQPGRPATADLVRASLSRRALAWLIDYGLLTLVGVALIAVALDILMQNLPGYLGRVAVTAGWWELVTLLTQHGFDSGSLTSAASDGWLDFVTPLLVAFAAVPLLQFVYQLMLLAWRGKTIGKAIVDIRVAPARPPARAGAPRGGRAGCRALATTVVDSGLGCLALILLATGEFMVGLLVGVAALVAFCLNIVMAVGPRRRTLVDRLAGTVVIPAGSYAEAVRRATALARRASDVADGLGVPAEAARRWAGAAAGTGRGYAGRVARVATAAGRTGIDTVADRLARARAEALPRGASVPQLLGSRAVERAQGLGVAGTERARRIGARARQLREDRRERRGEQRACPPAAANDVTP
jgi:RDD family protein